MAHEWKIRNMDEADSREAVKAAERQNTTTAVWLGQAIRAHVATERGNGVPSHDVFGPQQPLTPEMITQAGPMPQWLRRRVHRLLGETLGVEPPKPPKRRTETARLAAPQPVEPSDTNELDAAA